MLKKDAMGDGWNGVGLGMEWEMGWEVGFYGMGWDFMGWVVMGWDRDKLGV